MGHGSESGVAQSDGQCGASQAGSPLTAGEMRAWRMIRSASVRLNVELNRQLMEAADLSLSEFDILVRLSEADDGALRMAELAEVTELSRSRLTHTLNRLERRGLVSRFTCPSDRRGVHCAITISGRETLAQAAPAHLMAVKKHCLDRFTSSELTTLTEMLERLLN